MLRRTLAIVLVSLGLGAAAGGCEKTDHDTVDKWKRTENGVGKLQKAVADESLDADLSAHAAANLLQKREDGLARDAITKLSPARQQVLIDKLAPRLWEHARVADDLQLPSALQISAKDMLVFLRKLAAPTQKAQLDGYLIDWYCVTSYEKRAEMGGHLGASVMRMIGPPAAKKLMAVVDGVIAAPGQEVQKRLVHSELLLGLAATGSPEAVTYVLDLVKLDRGDASLAKRALDALYKAYVNSGGLFDPADREALAPNLPALVAIAKNPAIAGEAIDDAIALIRTIGAPRCTDVLIGMVGAAQRGTKFKYVTATHALGCGGAPAIVRVVQALPTGDAYDQRAVADNIVKEITKLSPRAEVLAALRQLLTDRSVVARWVAAESLAALGSVEDAAAIRALASSKERLLGYWGDDAEGKQAPTLGQRATELAAGLAK